MRSIVRITSAPTSRRLLTSDYALQMLDLKDDDRGKVEEIIDGVSIFIEGYCNRILARQTVEETWRLRELPDSLFLTGWPLSSISSITENDVALVADTDYEIDPEAGELFRLSNDCRVLWGGLFTAGFNYETKVVATYLTGYVAADASNSDVPTDLRDAALSLVKSNWFSRTRDPMIRSEEDFQVATTQYWVGQISESGLTADVEAVLNRYRRRAVG